MTEVDTEMFSPARVAERIRAREAEYAIKLINKNKIENLSDMGRVTVKSQWQTPSGYNGYALYCSNGHEFFELDRQPSDTLEKPLFSCDVCQDTLDTLDIWYVDPFEFDPARPIKGNGVNDTNMKRTKEKELTGADYVNFGDFIAWDDREQLADDAIFC